MKLVEAVDEDALLVRQCHRFDGVSQHALGVADELVDTSVVRVMGMGMGMGKEGSSKTGFRQTEEYP